MRTRGGNGSLRVCYERPAVGFTDTSKQTYYYKAARYVRALRTASSDAGKYKIKSTT